MTTLIEREGDIFDTRAEAIAHGVNLHGVMGAGIAKTVREKYPEVYHAYREACFNGDLTAGGMQPVLVQNHKPERYILNLASQVKPGADARLELIHSSATAAMKWASENGISAVAFPRIGSAIGGLDWLDVRSTLVSIVALHPDVKMELWTFVPKA